MRISRLKFAKFQEYNKNKPKAEILLKICKYNTISGENQGPKQKQKNQHQLNFRPQYITTEKSKAKI